MESFKLKDYNLNDTIAALATFPSKAALGVIKVSGKKAIDIVSQIFLPKKKKNIKKVKTYTLHYGWIIDRPKTKNVVDEVLVSIMRSPYSYTKEDVAEISCHGGVVVLDKILKMILSQGARLAYPGEFTYRALMRGRIDLIEAESIVGIVEARSQEALRWAGRQLRGEFSQRLTSIKRVIKDIFIQSEAYINFPEEDIAFPLKEIKKKLKIVGKEADNLMRANDKAAVLKEGIKCVIAGKVNAGKSTLFNRLLRQERMIVSRTKGTTRDAVEELINIRGLPLRIYDTAGILEPEDFIAKKAREKTSQVFKEADLIILVFDGSKKIDRDDSILLKKTGEKNTIFVVNKIDLPQKLKQEDIAVNKKDKLIYVSALKGEGIERLEREIVKRFYKGKEEGGDAFFLSNYQKIILANIKSRLSQAKEYIEKRYPCDFINLSLKECLDDFDKLTGKSASEDILRDIFSNFCIGK